MSRILMITSEAAPFAKTGGLADVLGALPPALAKLGEEVAVVMPRYASVPLHGSTRISDGMRISVGPNAFTVGIDQVEREGVRYLFVDCPPLYARPGVYSEDGVAYVDNHIRFGLLNEAALEIGRSIFKPDIFHAHDWPGGLLAPYLRENYGSDPDFAGVKSIITIHNLGYQGNFPAAAISALGLSPTLFLLAV